MDISLVFTIIVAVILISIVYRRRIISGIDKDKSWIYHNKVLVLLLGMTILPLFLLNVFYPERHIYTPEDAVYMGEKYSDDKLYLKGLKELAERDSTDIRKQIEYIHEYLRFPSQNQGDKCWYIVDFYDHSEEFHKRMAHAYAEYYCKGLEMNIAYMNNFPDTVQYINFMKAIYYLQNKNLGKVEEHVFKELEVNPTFDLNIQLIYTLYSESNEDSLSSLMEDRSKSKYLPYYLQNNYHFLHGNWGLYFANEIDNRLFNVGFFTLFAAFSVSFIWILFLRAMDMYNREKWRDILIVFLLGSVFTFFCLPIYDYAQLVAGWHINGDAINDFFYCTVVIGGSEELVKMLPWLIFGFFSRKLREPFDYILYASVAALGFAFVENLMYLENYHNIVVRSIMSTVGHMFDAAIIAYAFIIARFRMKKGSPWKWLVILLGFALAMLAHGFYDYWLISPSAQGYQLVTVLFFIASLSVWFYFKNNAMNHSPYFVGNQKFRVGYQQDLMTFSMIGVLMLEYILMSLEIGAENAQSIFIGSSVYVGAFVLFISSELDNFSLEKGVWKKLSFAHKFKFKRLRSLFDFVSHGGYETNQAVPEEANLIGTELRLFAPKTNLYVGNKLPVSGVCIQKIEVGGNPNWYVFKLNTPIAYSTYVSDRIIIKNKDLKDSLLDDKIEIYFMFVPNESVFRQHIISVEDLRYVGRVYSRPVGKV